MIRAPRQAEVMIEAVRADDGPTFRTHLFRQPQNPFAPVLVCMPAMGTKGEFYLPLAHALFGSGLQVAIGELRGRGSSSVRARSGAKFGYHELIAYDYPALFETVGSVFPGAPYFLLGHSLGGQPGMLYLSRHQKITAGAVLVATPSCYYRGWRFPKNLGVLVGSHVALLLSECFGFFPGSRIGFAGDEAKHVMRDWARQVRTGRYQPRSAEDDFEHLLTTLELPVLAVAIAGDDLAPEAAINRLCGKLQRAEVMRWKYNPRQVAGLHRHFAWVRDSDALVARICQFVTAGKL